MPDPKPGEPSYVKCHTEGCEKRRMWRGLCRSCYGQAKKIMEKDEVTWEDLEAMGLTLPNTDGKPFLAAYYKKQKERQNG